MPTHGFYIRSENYRILSLKSDEAGCSMSEYLNRLIEGVSGELCSGDDESVNADINVGSTPTTSIKLKPKENLPDHLEQMRCKECKQVKMAGRCINKNCKLKGKFQG